MSIGTILKTFSTTVNAKLPKRYDVAEVSAATASETTSQTLQQGEGKTYRLDAIGQVCPFPLVEAKTAIKQLERGDHLIIDFDCTQATDSIPNWAAASGYPVTNFEKTGDATWTITVQKL